MLKNGEVKNYNNKMQLKEPVSLNKLARESGENKSKLSHYIKVGLLKPVVTVGSMYIFEKSDAIAILKEIKKGKDKKMTLKQIKEKLDKK